MTQQELKNKINNYNWDDGFDVPTNILNQPACDLALALEIFYLSDGYGYFQLLVHNIGGSLEWLRFISTLYDDINAGKYRITDRHYEIPLTKVQKYQLSKANTPSVFLTDI